MVEGWGEVTTCGESVLITRISISSPLMVAA